MSRLSLIQKANYTPSLRLPRLLAQAACVRQVCAEGAIVLTHSFLKLILGIQAYFNPTRRFMQQAGTA